MWIYFETLEPALAETSVFYSQWRFKARIIAFQLAACTLETDLTTELALQTLIS